MLSLNFGKGYERSFVGDEVADNAGPDDGFVDHCLPVGVGLGFHRLLDSAEYFFGCLFEIRSVAANKEVDVRMAELVDDCGQDVFGEQGEAFVVSAPGAEDTVNMAFFGDSYSGAIAVWAV